MIDGQKRRTFAVYEEDAFTGRIAHRPLVGTGTKSELLQRSVSKIVTPKIGETSDGPRNQHALARFVPTSTVGNVRECADFLSGMCRDVDPKKVSDRITYLRCRRHK